MNGGKRELNVSTTKTLLKWNAYRTYEEVQQFHSYCRLDPYSNGMKIELIRYEDAERLCCLDPYSNGMKIKQHLKAIKA